MTKACCSGKYIFRFIQYIGVTSGENADFAISGMLLAYEKSLWVILTTSNVKDSFTLI